jgi:DinB superfamily
MDTRLDTVTESLYQTAELARSSFGTFSNSQLNWKPTVSSWSVAQCLDHLITTHSQYFPLLENLASGEAKATLWENASPLSGFFGRYLIKSLDPANLKKMKAPGKAQPSESDIDGDIVERFSDHQHQLIEHLEKVPTTVDPMKTIITSPLLGIVTYSLDDCYTILVVHCQRHLDQAKRVAGGEAFPR